MIPDLLLEPHHHLRLCHRREAPCLLAARDVEHLAFGLAQVPALGYNSINCRFTLLHHQPHHSTREKSLRAAKGGG